MDTKTLAVYDKLAGGVKNYAESYRFAKKNGYSIDYSIPETIMDMVDIYSYGQIMRVNNLNDLPDYMKQLIALYMPAFLEENPWYEGEECLRLEQ